MKILASNYFILFVFFSNIIFFYKSQRIYNFLSEKENSKFSIKNLITKNNFSTDLAKYFIDLASYSYCSEEQIKANLCCTKFINSEKWVLLHSDTVEFANYNFAILKNDENKKIIFTFTGTRGIPQFIQEAMSSSGVLLKDQGPEKIMSFFNSIFFEIQGLLRRLIADIVTEYPEYQYIFTGHSLGGSMASIVLLDILRVGFIRPTETNPVLITFGQPRTGNDIFSNELMKRVPIIFRIVRQGDLIASFPRCNTVYFSSICNTVLNKSKFNKNLVLTDEQKENELTNYLTWHIGGLKLFEEEEMNNYVDCGDEYGDNHPSAECAINTTYSTKRHIMYFGKWVSRYCKNNLD